MGGSLRAGYGFEMDFEGKILLTRGMNQTWHRPLFELQGDGLQPFVRTPVVEPLVRKSAAFDEGWIFSPEDQRLISCLYSPEHLRVASEIGMMNFNLLAVGIANDQLRITAAELPGIQLEVQKGLFLDGRRPDFIWPYKESRTAVPDGPVQKSFEARYFLLVRLCSAHHISPRWSAILLKSSAGVLPRVRGNEKL